MISILLRIASTRSSSSEGFYFEEQKLYFVFSCCGGSTSTVLESTGSLAVVLAGYHVWLVVAVLLSLIVAIDHGTE